MCSVPRATCIAACWGVGSCGSWYIGGRSGGGGSPGSGPGSSGRWYIVRLALQHAHSGFGAGPDRLRTLKMGFLAKIGTGTNFRSNPSHEGPFPPRSGLRCAPGRTPPWSLSGPHVAQSSRPPNPTEGIRMWCMRGGKAKSACLCVCDRADMPNMHVPMPPDDKRPCTSRVLVDVGCTDSAM